MNIEQPCDKRSVLAGLYSTPFEPKENVATIMLQIRKVSRLLLLFCKYVVIMLQCCQAIGVLYTSPDKVVCCPQLIPVILFGHLYNILCKVLKIT